MARKHKPILFDAIREKEQQNKKDHTPTPRRRVMLYNVFVSFLGLAARVIAAVAASMVGSLILTAFVSSVSTGTPMGEVLAGYWDAIVNLFK